MKVLISSTCYDLKYLREALAKFLTECGYQAVLSDNYDILYDPEIHTHDSCIATVESCDLIIYIMSARFGGKLTPNSLNLVNELNDSKGTAFWENVRKGNVSVTQAEVIAALQNKIPVLTFVEQQVTNQHQVYGQNKKKKNISFPGFKEGTHTYIFDFLDYLRLRNINNAYFDFQSIDQLLSILKKQLALLFSRSLKDRRERKTQEPDSGYVFSRIVNSGSPERTLYFNKLFEGISPSDEIKILGTGVTKFLGDPDNAQAYLRRGNTVKILLVNDKIIKDSSGCFEINSIGAEGSHTDDNISELISGFRSKHSCQLPALNVLINQSHFLKYYQRPRYITEIAATQESIKYLQELIIEENLPGKLEVKHFFSLIPMSITAIDSKNKNNLRSLAEFIIPFTENRILLRSSLEENKEIYNLLVDFFDSTWGKAKILTD